MIRSIRSFIAIGALVALPGFISLALAHEFMAGSLHIDHPWARATPPGANVAGGFMEITNTGDAPDRLFGGSSAMAERVEIHSMDMADGVMRMRPLADGLEIPSGESVSLAPGGLHIMLIGLTAPLAEGDSVPVTLMFEHAGSVDIELSVDAAGAGADDGGSHANH